MPGAYKDIIQVMDEQSDLVDTLAHFDPKLVRMAGK
jgi:tRNA-splicing ligase RtcB